MSNILVAAGAPAVFVFLRRPKKLIATALVVFIGGFELWSGLKPLEVVEKYSLETKLAIFGIPAESIDG